MSSFFVAYLLFRWSLLGTLVCAGARLIFRFVFVYCFFVVCFSDCMYVRWSLVNFFTNYYFFDIDFHAGRLHKDVWLDIDAFMSLVWIFGSMFYLLV